MKIKMTIKNDSDKKNDILKIMKENLSKAGYEKVLNGADIIEVSPFKKLKKIISESCQQNLEDGYEAIVTEDDDDKDLGIKYIYNDVMKKIFLVELGREWELENAIKRAADAFLEVEKMEVKFGKSMLEFSKDELDESLRYFHRDHMYYKLKFRLNVFSRYEKYWSNLLIREDGKAIWNDMFKNNNFVDSLGQEIDSGIVTKDKLISLFQQSPNPQNSILPVLIFEGVRLTDSEDSDEVRKLQISDIKKDRIIIRDPLNQSKVSREIAIDEHTYKMIFIAASQTIAYKTLNGTISIFDYIKSPYVLKPIDVPVAYNPDSKIDERAITYRGAYHRMLNIRALAESLEYDLDFTATHIAKSGKIHYIKQYMKEKGVDKYDAIRMTLMRFGDWTTTGEYAEEKKLPSNRQSVNRLNKDFVTMVGE